MKTTRVLVTSACRLAATLCSAQNLLTNGSFELPGGFPIGSQLYINAGGNQLTGWTVGGTGGIVL